MNAERLMLIAAIAAFLLTIHRVRSRDLRERFAIWWLVVSALLLLPGWMPGLVTHLAKATNLSYPSLILFFALAAIYVFSLFVCVSLTDQHRRTNRLTQELALLKNRLEAIETRQHDDERDVSTISIEPHLRNRAAA